MRDENQISNDNWEREYVKRLAVDMQEIKTMIREQGEKLDAKMESMRRDSDRRIEELRRDSDIKIENLRRESDAKMDNWRREIQNSTDSINKNVQNLVIAAMVGIVAIAGTVIVFVFSSPK